MERTSEESSIRSISRRILAWSVVGTFLFLILLSTAGYILKYSWAVKVYSIATSMYSSFLAVMSFYFVSHIGNSWIDRTKNK